MIGQKIKNDTKKNKDTQPKLLSYVVCFFNPISKMEVQESLDRVQSTLNRADDIIKKSGDTNMRANQFLSEFSK